MRRKDVEDILGDVPAPKITAGQFLIDILFQVGPFRGELPLCEGDLEPWERRREIDLLPWQAELIVEMSKAYMDEMHKAKDVSALCPWPPGVKMWMHVTSKKNAPPQKKETAKE